MGTASAARGFAEPGRQDLSVSQTHEGLGDGRRKNGKGEGQEKMHHRRK